ncbi:hypothetical protein HED54_18760 [Ochrobactrum anthropi ATCC 49188]|nr:hypothetical protein [Brucella anthropi ATCC 49188]
MIWFIQIGVSQRSARYQSGFHLSRRSSFPNSVSLFGKQDAQFKRILAISGRGEWQPADRKNKNKSRNGSVSSVLAGTGLKKERMSSIAETSAPAECASADFRCHGLA